MIDMSMALAKVIEHSKEMTEWAIMIFGASVLAVISTSYHRPSRLRQRLPYLFFIPGWSCIAYSLIMGEQLGGNYLASFWVKPDRLTIIGEKANKAYADQSAYLLYGLAFFALWLTFYLYFWVFRDDATGDKE